MECLAFLIYLFIYFESLTFFLSLTFRRVCVNKIAGMFQSGCAKISVFMDNALTRFGSSILPGITSVLQFRPKWRWRLLSDCLFQSAYHFQFLLKIIFFIFVRVQTFYYLKINNEGNHLDSKQHKAAFYIFQCVFVGKCLPIIKKSVYPISIFFYS